MKIGKVGKGLKKEGKPKKTRQGKSINTKISRTPSNGKQKKYRGQG
jgi:hypothetical protein